MRLLMRALEPGTLTRLQTEWTERQENTPKFSPEAGKTLFLPQPNARGTTGGPLGGVAFISVAPHFILFFFIIL